MPDGKEAYSASTPHPAANSKAAEDEIRIQSLQNRLTAALQFARAAEAEAAALRSKWEKANRQAWDNKVRRADATARLRERERSLEQIQSSPIWKTIKPIWKLYRHFAGKRIDAATLHEDLLFGLEAPETWTCAHEILLVKGWCFSRTGRPLAGVRAKVGRKAYFARYGLEREELASRFPEFPEAIHSGFTIEIRLRAGTHPLQLEAIAQGEEWERFFEERIMCTSSASSEPPSRGDGQQEKQVPLALFPGLSSEQLLRQLEPLFRRHTALVELPRPRFSIVTPTHNPEPKWLAEAAASLLHQTFPEWEWCLVDDGSESRVVRGLLEKFAALSPRVRVRFGDAAGISSATNQALDLATGDYICFLDHDDLLDPKALETMAEAVEKDFDIVYSDEDKLDDKRAELVEPFFKPDWSPEYFRGVMYVGHLLCVRRELACEVRFDPAYDGVQDFEFVLRASESGARIGHVSEVLYHWRKTANSVADSAEAKPRTAELQEQAVNAHLRRVGLAGRAQQSNLPHRLEIRPAGRQTFPLVTIIIPTKDAPDLLARCLKSISERTSYPTLEILLLDNESTDEEALRLMRESPVRRIHSPNPFNFSRANNLGSAAARGEFLVFLNNDTEILARDWLEQLLYYAEQPDVGAAGGLLVYEDRTVQHAGVALGMRGTADHTMRGFPMAVDGYAGSLACAREVSAVTGACLMIRKSLFDEIGGFNEHFFTAYQDVDLCLRLRDRGLRIIYSPRALAVHHESVSRRTFYDMIDRMLLLDLWETVIDRGDPYYNPNLNLERGDYSRAHRE